MKQILFSSSLLIFFARVLSAQDSLTINRIEFRISLYSFHSGIQMGYLRSLTDSTLVLSNKTHSREIVDSVESSFHRFHYSDLGNVRIQRPGTLGKGIVIGGISVGAIGVLFGYIASQPIITFGNSQQHAGDKYIGTGALAGAIVGGFIGGVIGGLAHKTFAIGGRKERFAQMQRNIFERVFAQNKNNP